MNSIIHLFVLFIYIYLILFLNIPKLKEDNRIKAKLYLFCSIFIFEVLCGIFSSIYHRCVVNISSIAKTSFVVSLLAVIAYSVYEDLRASHYFEKEKKNVRLLVLTIMIIIFMMVGLFLNSLFNGFVPEMNECLNSLYKK
jgi:peptidoglycan/LPS O-acetylase OafA/YrhL